MGKTKEKYKIMQCLWEYCRDDSLPNDIFCENHRNEINEKHKP